MASRRIRDANVRQRLFLLRDGERLGVSAACRKHGKHRSYYYYWHRRWVASGRCWRSLVSRSTRPRRSPRQTHHATARRILRARTTTGYGKNRLGPLLGLPCSTVGRVLQRAGVTKAPRRWRTQKKHPRRYELPTPGQRVQLDVKYVPFRIKGRQHYQYTLIDECTRLRYLMFTEELWSIHAPEIVRRAERYFGFRIRCVQTDNGTEFTFRYTAELQAKRKRPKAHPLDTYCQEHGIQHRCIPPGEKELNGKVERSHRTDMEEFYNRYATRPTVQQLRTDMRRWMERYNTQRPHSSLGGMTPWGFAKQRLKKIRNEARR